MKFKFHLAKITFATLMVMSSASFAEPHDAGVYTDINVGALYEGVHFLGYHSSAWDSAGINGNLGYQLSRYFAVESGYTYYGHGLNNVDAAAKFILPFTLSNQDFSVFAKLGPAFIFRNGRSGVLPYAGIGGSVAINKKLDVTLQAQGITDGFASLGLVSLGLAYHF